MKRPLLATVLCLLLGGMAASGVPKPNIILVLVDDMGWGDTSVNAGEVKSAGPQAPVIETPAMERMARQGVQLRRHYTAAPVCAPARASLFSGTHQGHTEVVRNNNFDAPLENTHTLASVLQQAGYATALIGKWGIGGGNESGGTPETAQAWPTKRGFDYFFGYHNHIAGHRHYPKEEHGVDPDTGGNAVWDGDNMITDQLDTCYTTDLFTARAKKWITDHTKQHAGQPFFLALTLTAPHARLAVPSCPYPSGGGLRGGVQWMGKPGKMINTAKGKWDSFIHPRYTAKKLAAYAKERFAKNPRITEAASRHATMITRIDDALGDLMKLCDDLKISDNTIMVFTSDNGPHREAGAVAAIPGHPAPQQNPAFYRSYGNYDGIKRDVWEGGVRVPCLVWAPALSQNGLVSYHPGQFHDWMATFADLAGVPKPMRSDGVSLMPTLKGEPGQKDGIVYSEYKYNGGMDNYDDYAPNKKGRRRGEQQFILFRNPQGKYMKAIRTNIQSGQDDFEIYDLEADPHEANNLAGQYPEMQDTLRAAVLYNRRAFDVARDPAAGKRVNGFDGARNYDSTKVPPNADAPANLQPGLTMRQLKQTTPWVPDFDTLPGADRAPGSIVSDPAAVELPAGSITEFSGYLNIPADGDHWHFSLQLDEVEGSKAYLKMHNFQLIDADFNYKPGTKATESAAANAQGVIPEKTGKKGIPLKAGLHEVKFVVVQGPSAPGKMKLEWYKGQQPAQPIPAEAYRTSPAVK